MRFFQKWGWFVKKIVKFGPRSERRNQIAEILRNDGNTAPLFKIISYFQFCNKWRIHIQSSGPESLER